MRGDGSGSRASRPRRSRVAFSATRPAPSWSNPGEGHCRGASPSWLASILLATGGRRADFAPWPIDSTVLKSAAGVRRFVRSPQRRSARYQSVVRAAAAPALGSSGCRLTRCEAHDSWNAGCTLWARRVPHIQVLYRRQTTKENEAFAD
ncbi:hypothetical protein MTO96_009771 [Rhipicephalus appendiculatus]